MIIAIRAQYHLKLYQNLYIEVELVLKQILIWGISQVAKKQDRL